VLSSIVRKVEATVLPAAVGCSQGEPAANAPAPSAPTAPAETGLRTREVAPEFTLKDQDGKEQSLDELRKTGKVALVFVRSVVSSPHCRQHLVDLKDARKPIEEAGLKVVVISPDSVPALKEFAKAQKLSFPLFSDAGGKTARAYAVTDPKDETAVVPGAYLLDRAGIIRVRMFYPLIQLRVTPSELVDAARKVE
jgi:peroxiredoxin Q/BCP